VTSHIAPAAGGPPRGSTWEEVMQEQAISNAHASHVRLRRQVKDCIRGGKEKLLCYQPDVASTPCSMDWRFRVLPGTLRTVKPLYCREEEQQHNLQASLPEDHRSGSRVTT